MESNFMSKSKRPRKIGTGKKRDEGNEFDIFNEPKPNKVDFESFHIFGHDTMIFAERITRSKRYSDAFIFQTLAMHLDNATGICMLKQADIVKKIGIRKSEVSEAIARLSKPLLPAFEKNADGWQSILPELIRKYDDEKTGLRGFALNPAVVMIGSHDRAKSRWLEAEQQAIAKADKAAQAAIANAAESSALAEELDGLVSENDIDFL
jgi:hypothetical protein